MLSRLLSIVLLFTMFHAYAQQTDDKPHLETQVRFAKVALNEDIEVSFVFYGSGVETLDKPDLKEFEIVRGPLQSSSQSMTVEQGVEVKRESLKMTYMLRAKHKGMHEIGKAKAVTKDGKVYYSEPLKIEVTGEIEVAERDGNYPRVETDMGSFLTWSMDNETRYVVATGPLFYHGGAKPQRGPGALTRDIRAALAGVSTITELVTYVWNTNKPRIYIGLKDTSHVLEHLSALYAGYGDAKYFTSVKTIEEYIFGESAATLGSVSQYYQGFENMKSWLGSEGKDTVNPRKITFTWIFSSKVSRDAFNNRVAMIGYAIDSMNEAAVKYDKPVTFYSVTISHTVELKNEVMWRKADELLEIAESLNGSFNGMTIAKDGK